MRVRRDFGHAGRATTLAAILLGGGPVHAYTSPAPDVVVFTEPTMRPAVEAVGALFRARTGASVRTFASPSSMLVAQVPHTRCDVVIVQGRDAVAQAMARKAVSGEGTVLGRNHLVLARKGAGAAQPLDGVTGDGGVAVVDAPVPDGLGALTQGALSAAHWPAAGTRMQGVARAADAAFLLGSGAVSLAVLYATDVAADPSFSAAAALPDGAEPITYVAFLSGDPNSPNSAGFLAFLRTPEAVAALRGAGLDVERQ